MSHVNVEIKDQDGKLLDWFVVCPSDSEDAGSFSDEENVGTFDVELALVTRIKAACADNNE